MKRAKAERTPEETTAERGASLGTAENNKVNKGQPHLTGQKGEKKDEK